MKIIELLINHLNKIVNKIKNRNYRYHCILSETLPVYHDSFRTTDKNVIILNQNDDRINRLRLESQNGKPVKFHREFDSNKRHLGKHTGNPEFTWNEIKQGQIYGVTGAGFLEDENHIYEISLITDEYVYFKNLEINYIYPRSYKEIKLMKELNAINLIGNQGGY
ncbi:MAG TPA: hypothetical protein GXZ90_00460 [Clostridiales bacterium]|nr:hypothetical protein [Clostridiales bacterium]